MSVSNKHLVIIAEDYITLAICTRDEKKENLQITNSKAGNHTVSSGCATIENEQQESNSL